MGGMTTSRRISTTRALCLGALAAAVGVAGCGGSSRAGNARAGSAAPATVTHIVLQATDPGDPETVYLAKQIGVHSHGTLSVRIASDYNSTLPSNEVGLAKAVRAGSVSFAFGPTREWQSAGAPAFAALQAPFVLSNYSTARAAVAGPAGRLLLSQLSAAGVHPLALVPLQLRRILSVTPIRSQGDLDGLRVRIIDNPTTKAAFTAFGAVPVEGLSPPEADTKLKEHKIDAVETAPNVVGENGYDQYAKYLSGFALFDKVDSFVASNRAWERLAASQRQALEQAAQDVVRIPRVSGPATTLPCSLCADRVCG
jgi:TRAP-type C4-dicarboxylate transport system substrate-binding protein